ncbi:uncharacterized protein LOC134837965 [Culicoides brevitarsis]|uniref:uncharacterized protein LOC134837965 n=1 Tax=Culicoides brevitarsis TaxID=469753 RepID=UPI00307B57FC
MVQIVLYEKTRDEIREDRKEFNLIVRRCNELGFEYVLKPQEFTSRGLCFGSKLPREVLAQKGPTLNSFMRAFTPESNSKVGPGSYSLRKPSPHVPNIYGLVSKSLRFTPVIADDIKKKFIHADFYEVRDIGKKRIKRDYKPFGSGCELREKESFKQIPAVGTYNVPPKPKKMFYHYSFGGKIIPICPVKMICQPQHLDKCSICEISPEKDYFKHVTDEKCLCLKCMVAERDKAKYKSKSKSEKLRRLKELESQFQLTRYCGFYHQHENTTAKIRLLEPRDLKLKLKREHYLSQFIN